MKFVEEEQKQDKKIKAVLIKKTKLLSKND